ncbi:MAG: choice-of-anchor J domain-containing protein [Bacteroides sp.]|nr:choice-of-anchor J domain-containing protein [Ruminococcus flavefaciens]MCM1555654.1 choice-of-anchor J domain-containing protein [Bacteroides sp.]
MKKMLVSLGLSVSVLLSAALAQPTMLKTKTASTVATSSDVQQSSKTNPRIVERVSAQLAAQKAAAEAKSAKAAADTIPDISAQEIILPVVGCEIDGPIEISLVVANSGKTAIDSYTIWYTIKGGTDTVKQQVDAKLDTGKSVTHTFTTKMAELKEDSLYIVYAGITPLEGEKALYNNKTERRIIKKAPATLPYKFSVANNDFMTSNEDAWAFSKTDDEITAYIGYLNIPVVSRCFNLTGGKHYRLTYEFFAGLKFLFWEYSETYSIYFGKTSDPLSEWDSVYRSESGFIEDYQVHEVTFSPKEDGTYAFFFQVEESGVMGILNISLAEMADHDIRLNEFTTGLSRLLPIKHVNRDIAITTTIENRGVLDIDKTNVSINLNGNVIGKQEVSNLSPDSIHSSEFTMELNGLNVNDQIELIATASIENEPEAYLFDDTITKTLEITDSIMAFDYITETFFDSTGIGESSPIGVGLPFRLTVKDTLTAVSIAWAKTDVQKTVGIRIQEWDPATLIPGKKIYETSVRRGTTIGFYEYPMPSIILDAGYYMISAMQLTDENYGLLADGTEDGSLYISTYSPARLITGFGTPGIRAVFGTGKPMEKDIFVEEITKPAKSALFAENQEVTATVGSNGYADAKVPVSLMVNGKVVDTKTVSIEAYGKTEVSFTADLSAPDTEFELTVFAALEGDEDPANDTARKTIKSFPEPNPYVMDWEYCEDFIIDNFTPAWRAIDVDKAMTWGIDGCYFPNSGSAFAFIAFNPDVADLTNFGGATHGGDRYGAALSARADSNNDWLVSPKLKLLGEDAEMNFFVRSYNAQYGLERYNVLVSPSDEDLDSFIQIGETREAPAGAWNEVKIDLGDYAGKEIHVAIQCVSKGAFMFMIDDITVFPGTSNTGNANTVNIASHLSLYPNPAHEMINIHAEGVNINQVSIFNLSGMMLYNSKTLNQSDFRYSTSGLNTGIYFARVITDQGSAVLKFVVQ